MTGRISMSMTVALRVALIEEDILSRRRECAGERGQRDFLVFVWLQNLRSKGSAEEKKPKWGKIWLVRGSQVNQQFGKEQTGTTELRPWALGLKIGQRPNVSDVRRSPAKHDQTNRALCHKQPPSLLESNDVVPPAATRPLLPHSGLNLRGGGISGTRPGVI